jgi:hypothetical protein
MLTRRTASVLVIAALTLGVVALPAQAALRHIEGTVVSKNAGDHSFRIKTQNGNRLRIKVNSDTRFQRIAGGFGGLHAGLAIEVDAKSSSNGLLATQVESRGSGGGGGADDGGHHGGGGADDGANHT